MRFVRRLLGTVRVLMRKAHKMTKQMLTMKMLKEPVQKVDIYLVYEVFLHNCHLIKQMERYQS